MMTSIADLVSDELHDDLLDLGFWIEFESSRISFKDYLKEQYEEWGKGAGNTAPNLKKFATKSLNIDNIKKWRWLAMLKGKGWDLNFKSGYAYGYTLYATHTLEKLEKEYTKAAKMFNQDTLTEWYLGMMEGIEYAIYLKKMGTCGGLTEVK